MVNESEANSTVDLQNSTFEDVLPAETGSTEATMALGEQLAERLERGDIVALYGELGTGKTHLVKGIAAGLGIPPKTVRSPTFTILREYDAGRLPLYHFDAYRIGDPSEFEAIGFEEYAYGEGVTVIEWASRVEDLLPPNALRLRLTHVSERKRLIERIEGGE